MEWISTIGKAVWDFFSRRWFSISTASGAGFVVEKSWWPTEGPWLEIAALLIGAGGLAVKVIDTFWKWKDRKAQRRG